MSNNNPILNSPYEEPKYHYATDQNGALNYQDIREGRRIFAPDIHSIPTKQGPQGKIFEVNDLAAQYETELINLVRKEVKQWRDGGYTNTTRVTKELLTFWFKNPDRLVTKNLFFAQREAIETAIWLNEVAGKSNAGQNVINRLEKNCKAVSNDPSMHLPRYAFKMATGTGKTVVMGALILYHFFNRQEYRNDTRFADYFLLVAPGVTIRDRLGVLRVDTENKNAQDIKDYYRERGLVPDHYVRQLLNLNSRIVITNYHAFEPKTLQGNKKSPFDGKKDASGKKQEAKEDYSLVIKRLMGNFKQGGRLLVLNDEAHHCYLPKAKGKKTDEDNSQEENERAAVWYTGLTEIGKRFKLMAVYDLSATPYYLQGSGYQSYKLFGWVVSDFGLIEAIESGLVKIPFLPESDNTQDLEGAKLRNLYDHVKEELPRKGQRGKKKEAKKKGEMIGIEAPPKIPPLVKGALDQFYNHYEHYFDGEKKKAEEKMDLFSEPPVFIVVCNNTSVSKEVYKFVAGYEKTDKEGNIIQSITGHYPLLSNYDDRTGTVLPKRKAPTLLIDSDALENSDQVNDDFKKIFASEIAEFRKEYARQKGSASAENISDAEILREVVNTVGKPGKLGSHIRCVVSVSMLTEGWDANTVTHIMGLRAFNSNLLCEQVAGRALRRKRYNLVPYDPKTGQQLPQNTRRTKDIVWKFPPEYAHIIGVPFKMFKSGKTVISDPPDYTHIRALPDREEEYEITFPNIDSYRIENKDGKIAYDFSNLESYQIDGSKFPTETIMETAFVPGNEKLEVKSVLEMRDQEIIYQIAREFLRHQFGDIDGFPIQRFRQVRDIVSEWYHTRLQVLNYPGTHKRLVYFESPKSICEHIARGVNTHINTSEYIRPVFNYYNPFSSTRYVNGNTTKEIYPTQKSHVNYVVADTDSWEQIAAKTLEELDEVKSYVKNEFLGFTIPYTKDAEERRYYPDFITRCKAPDGQMINLIIEITGANKTDKSLKKWFVENRWLPAVNAVKDKYEYDPWVFIEVANDLRDIKNQIKNIINSTSQTAIA
ncbi:DEAD/DEAH box helicase family protein [Catalinimonas sp. 4WD22]|uniref:BPTD_3080 family restriction endonuclease n=1 Tax=Catalinimonas locisalis TaxID=3133978 RepID=UPI0031018AC8